MNSLNLSHLNQIYTLKGRLDWWNDTIRKPMLAAGGGIKSSNYYDFYKRALQTSEHVGEQLPIPPQIYEQHFAPKIKEQWEGLYQNNTPQTTPPPGFAWKASPASFPGENLMQNYLMDLEAEDNFSYAKAIYEGRVCDDSTEWADYKPDNASNLLRQIEDFRATFNNTNTKESQSYRDQQYTPWNFNANPKTEFDAKVWAKYELFYNFLKEQIEQPANKSEPNNTIAHRDETIARDSLLVNHYKIYYVSKVTDESTRNEQVEAMTKKILGIDKETGEVIKDYKPESATKELANALGIDYEADDRLKRYPALRQMIKRALMKKDSWDRVK